MSAFSLAFGTGPRRELAGYTDLAIKIFAAGVTVWTVYAAAFARTDVLPLTIGFLSLMMVLTFLLVAPFTFSRNDRIGWFDCTLALLSAACGIYFLIHSDTIAERITLLDELTKADIFFATAITLLSVEVMRRTVGLGLTLIVISFMAYNLFGDLLSGPLKHGVITTTHFLDIMVFTTDGLFGVPLRVAATYAFLFVLFGTTLEKTGGSEFFFQLAASLTGRSPGGPAKIAVISSGLYGTISGSPTSDVVTTGAVTIPMMKRLGYSAAFAGAIEVAASTGGSLLPPVMGAAAFIMAEYTGIPYVEIAIAAIIPALLYYIPIYMQVHLRARRDNLAGLAEGISPLSQTLLNGGQFLLPLVAITWSLLEGYTPTYSALFGIAAVVFVSMFRKDTRLTPKIVWEILSTASLRMVAVAGACAAAGLVIGGITMTGLASKFSHLIFLVAGSHILPSMIMAAALTILLGLGMPTPSAYILAAVLMSPVLSELGINLLAGHMFLLYFAVMSALTPPVAVAAYAASAIANENPLRIAFMAVRFSLAAFIVPFAFVFNPALLQQGSWISIVLSTFSVGCGLVLLAIAMEGYFRTRINSFVRIAIFVTGMMFIFIPGFI